MEEGYIESTNQGLRIIGNFTTQNLRDIAYGMMAFLPLGLLLYFVALFIPQTVLPIPNVISRYIGIGVGVLPGAILGAITLPKRKITVLFWLYKKIKFLLSTKIYVFDRNYRETTNRRKYNQRLLRINKALEEQEVHA